MIHWEYKVLNFTEANARHYVEDQLNKLGERGWELTTAMNAGVFHVFEDEPTEKKQFYFVLRRRANSIDEVPMPVRIGNSR